MRILLFAFLLALLSDAACAGDQTTVANLTVKSGKSIPLGSGFWSIDYDSCRFIELKMETLVAPQLGRIAVQMINGTIPAQATGEATNPQCVGMPIKALRLIYTANKNAKGMDRVLIKTIQVNWDRNAFIFDYNITVE